MEAETIKNHERESREFTWKRKMWINSSLQIICWLCISRENPRHPRCENAADSDLCTPTNDECKLPNWKCVLRKCNLCRAIDLPGVVTDTSIRAPMIMFNTYMTQFTFSHHGILILKKITTYLDAKGKSKRICFLCEELIKIKTPDFTRGKLHERVKLFSMQRRLVIFTMSFKWNQSKN